MSETMAVKPEVAALLRRVKRRILAQPKRFDMNRWGTRKKPDDGGPACGTVACIAGWIALDGLTIAEVKGLTLRRFQSLMHRAPKIGEKAVGVLSRRLPDGSFYGHKLFVVDDWPTEFLERHCEAVSRDKRAAVAAERIEHFIRTGE